MKPSPDHLISEKPNLPDVVSQTADRMPEDVVIMSLSDIFKVLSDMTRLKIVFALLDNELCVSDLCQVVGLNQSAVSHQLRVLRGSSLVKYRKSGKLVYYSIDDDHVSGLIRLALEHMNHSHIISY